MNFIKTFEIKTGNHKGKTPGSLIIRNGHIKITINNNTVHFKQIGRTEKGIGVIVEKDDVKRKTNHITALFKYNNDYIPENFQGECYVFRIPAEKLSDTEYEFKFCNAKMKNKK